MSGEADSWSRILRLSREMLQRARQQEWTEVGELEAERSDLLRQYFSAPHDDSTLDGIRPKAGELLDLDKQLEGLARDAQADLSKDLRALRKGRSAAKAYR